MATQRGQEHLLVQCRRQRQQCSRQHCATVPGAATVMRRHRLETSSRGVAQHSSRLKHEPSHRPIHRASPARISHDHSRRTVVNHTALQPSTQGNSSHLPRLVLLLIRFHQCQPGVIKHVRCEQLRYLHNQRRGQCEAQRTQQCRQFATHTHTRTHHWQERVDERSGKAKQTSALCRERLCQPV